MKIKMLFEKKIRFRAACAVILCTLLAGGMTTACSENKAKGFPYSEYKLADYISMSDYNSVQVSASDLEYELALLYREACADASSTKTYTEPTNGINVQKGDVVSIDFTGYVDGKPFSGGSASDYSLTVGSGSFIDGFEDGLIGASVGEKLFVKTTFPSNYGVDELNGKEATFTVKVNSVKRTYYPEYNDENVAKYTSYATVSEFEAGERDGIVKNLIWQKLYSECEVKNYPEKELGNWYDSYIQTYEKYAQNYGKSLEDYVKYLGYSDLDTFYGYMASVAKNQVKQEMMLYSIVAEEGLGMTEEEYSAESNDYWKRLCDGGYTGTYEEFLESYTKETVQKTLYYERVLDHLLGVCRVV